MAISAMVWALAAVVILFGAVQGGGKMDSWGFNPATLSAFGSIGLVVAMIAVVAGWIQNRRARNMDAALQIFFDVRDRWEDKWGEILRNDAPNLNLEERHTGVVGKELTYMLNWLNWMGILIKNKWFGRDVVVDTLGPAVVEIIKVSAHKLQTDIKEHEPGWWGGVEYMANLKGIKINISNKADELRKQWATGAPRPDVS